MINKSRGEKDTSPDSYPSSPGPVQLFVTGRVVDHAFVRQGLAGGRKMKNGAIGVVLIAVLSSSAQGQSPDQRVLALESQVARLEATVAAQTKQIATLVDKLTHFRRDGDEVFITSANLHIVNGEGSTNTTNGLGNLIVGYSEQRGDGTDDRSGSHNVVVGPAHNFPDSAAGGWFPQRH